jgi:hypothetical protein
MKNSGMAGAIVFFFTFVMIIISNPCGYCEDPIIRSMRQLESDVISCDRQDTDYFGYIEGSIPVLISAPHGAKHFRTRENRWKAEDACTSALAIQLGKITGAHVIYLKNKSFEDPNHDVRTLYKDFIAEIVRKHGIRFIADLHGASGSRKFKVDIGILDDQIAKSSCPTLKPVIQKAFQGFQSNPFNQHFRANGRGTITYFAKHSLGIEAAQFEINARYRIVNCELSTNQEQKLLELLERFRIMINEIHKTMPKGNFH